jgi:archaemetzincin
VLKPRLPDDACAYIAFTTSDLWPGRGWNFVFGQASLRERVGVWSIYRFGDPEADDAAFRLCLKRTMKVGTHETGHMFSMLHCIAYRCNMNGSNHLAESDAQPVWLCPECMAKMCWMTRCDPVERYRKLVEFCKQEGLQEESAFYEKSVSTLEDDGE